jgi:hypothetical protein
VKIGETYKVTKHIKLHTKPLREADVSITGRFIKETENYYYFDWFKVRKNNIVDTKIVETA